MDERIPKYYMLKKEIIKKIDMEEYGGDEQIPSERELIEKYQVSRITVRKAIDELVNEGYLYKVQGKGTYVKSDKNNHDLISLTSCTEDVKKLGMTPSRKVIAADVVLSDKKRGKLLNIVTDDKVFRLERIIYADNEALNYTITYLPEKLFPQLEQYDFNKESLYHILQTKYDTKIIGATRTIEAVSAKDVVAEYLDIDEGVPIILFGGTTYGVVQGKEIPIETFKCYYRTDKFKFCINQIKQ